MAYLMGIDLGTSSVRAMLLEAHEGAVLVRGAPYGVDIPRLGWAEQDPTGWYRAACGVVRRVLAESGVDPAAVVAVSFSGQMHGLVAVDNKLQPVRPAIIWQDRRSANLVREWRERLGADYFAEQVQNAVSPGFLVASLAWLAQEEPETFRRIHKVMLPKDYLKLRLTGRVCTDPSDAAGSLAFDNRARCWADGLLETLGLDAALFPELLASDAVVGELAAQAATDCGLAPGTPVVGGGGDQFMQAVGNGIIRPGVFACNLGTGGQISTSAYRPVFDPLLRTNTFAHAVPGLWNVMGANLSSGAALKWLCEKVTGETDYKRVDAEAAALPSGSEGLIFLPYLAGERTPHLDPDARGVFFGLTLGHGAAHLARAVMEGVAFSLRDCLDLLTGELGLHCEQMVAAGGGAASSLWLQILADVLEQELRVSEVREQACLGAAITAGVGVGLYGSFAEGSARFAKLGERVYRPDPAAAARYRELHGVYRELYRRNRDLFALL